MLSPVPFCQKTFPFIGQPFHLETGRIARQSLASVVAKFGNCHVLCTVNVSHSAPSHSNFLPLSVYYQERACSAGRMLGGFVKRETKPSDKEVLSARLIDRTIRPLFAHDFHHEVQVICTVLSYDRTVDSSLVALLATNAALGLSGLPLSSSVAAVRVCCRDNGEFFIAQQAQEGPLDLVMAGTPSGVIMVEGRAEEVDESVMLQALAYGQAEIQTIIKAMQPFIQEAKRPVFHYTSDHERSSRFIEAIVHEGRFGEGRDEWNEICSMGNTQDQGCALNRLRDKILNRLGGKMDAQFEEGRTFSQEAKESLFYKAWKSQLREFILANKRRLDGRELDEIRAISCETGLLPSAHGSALFTRGMTQSLITITLSGKDESQLVDDPAGSYRDSFLLHYNFPPYATGDVGRVGAPSRREIGHGKLAWRALQAVLPKESGYTVRIVSDITESYGSSSMATVCASSLALKDAGYPIKRPVAGIAMGLVQNDRHLAILSDISGLEDGIGDMDFKVTGTQNGLTALQMDVKGTILSADLLKESLHQARSGIHHILREMDKMREDKSARNDNKPAYLTMSIPQDRIGLIIGPGGRTIRELSETYQAKIDIQSNGMTSIFSLLGKQGAERAIERIREMINR